MRLEIETPSPNSIETIAACSQLNSPAASNCSVANLFTQLNCYCDPTECKRSVYTRQSHMQTMQDQLLCRTYYAKHRLCEQCKTNSCYAAPIMQSTSYAKHLLMQTTAENFPPMAAPFS